MRTNPLLISYPSPDFSGASATDVREEIQDALGAGIKTFLINFQEIESMDSAGLRILVAILKDVQTAQGQLFLCSLNEPIQLLLEEAGISRTFSIFANQAEFQETGLGA
ncbi:MULTISPECIES: STAS domain-containing protein [Trichocoleus]|uniref:Anti-sigma factor antagonist n=1 Tax=Trichocoleus desertorum GB2-A4 TaxID=2933944 RepID=A0ABV0JHB1_9CYAN|nr:STAS domain-containing protein [Trichocoleus sp. FACHB-46]MBD1865705.1 STAS domain-containing protein [Trichocoleus sp. FACHB-46]